MSKIVLAILSFICYFNPDCNENNNKVISVKEATYVTSSKDSINCNALKSDSLFAIIRRDNDKVFICS